MGHPFGNQSDCAVVCGRTIVARDCIPQQPHSLSRPGESYHGQHTLSHRGLHTHTQALTQTLQPTGANCIRHVFIQRCQRMWPFLPLIVYPSCSQHFWHAIRHPRAARRQLGSKAGQSGHGTATRGAVKTGHIPAGFADKVAAGFEGRAKEIQLSVGSRGPGSPRAQTTKECGEECSGKTGGEGVSE